MNEGSGRPGGPGVQAAQLLAMAYGIAVLLGMLWLMTPEYRRRLFLAGMADKAAQVTGRLASRSGHAAMGRELASGVADYTLPLALASVRDRAESARDRLRCAP